MAFGAPMGSQSADVLCESEVLSSRWIWLQKGVMVSCLYSTLKTEVWGESISP